MQENNLKRWSEKDSEIVNEGIIDMLGQMGIGGNIVIGILLILSIYAIYIIIERYLNIRKNNTQDKDFLQKIADLITSKNIEDIKNLCQNTKSPISNMIEKGIDQIDQPLTNISATIETQGQLEIHKMDDKISSLATIAGAAPMIGFLGTVMGMIIAFQKMARETAPSPADLASGIYTAMITTAAGLVVGIIAYIAYNYLVSKVDKIAFRLESKSIEIIELLHNKHNVDKEKK